MSARRRILSVENLESRLNLSSLGGLSTPAISTLLSTTQEKSGVQPSTKVLSVHTVLKKTSGATSTTTIKAPANLAATITSTAISLKWADMSSNESGFRIFRSTDGVTFKQIGSVGKNKTSYTDSTAAVGVTYTYEVAAYTSSGQSPMSNKATAQRPVPLTAPLTPSALLASAISQTSISLSWTDNATNETGYHVFRSTDGVNYTMVAALGADSTSYSDAGLTAGTQYLYEVSAWNAAGESFSSAVSATTVAPDPAPLIAPSAPASLTVTGPTSSSLNLSWTDNNTNESGLHVFRSTDGTNFTQIGDLAANTTSFTDTGLAANQTYYYEVSAYNSAGETLSTIANGVTLMNAPTAPSGLSFANIATSSLSLSWSDAANDQAGFHVYRSTDGTTYSMVASLASNATSFADSGLNSGATYYYKVAAYNNGGETPSAAALASTPVAAPTAPSNLSFANLTTSSLTLKWNDNANNETGYRVYRSTDGTTFTKVADLSANSTSFSDSGLNASTKYYYEVSAYNSGGETVSLVASTTTSVTAPATPTNLTFAGVTASSLSLNWTDNANNETGYRVYRSTDGANFSKVADLGANATSFADSGLTGGVTYYYKVSAYNSGGETLSAASSTTTSIAAPSAPTNVNFTGVLGNSLTINWTDNASNETGYRVYRSTDGVNFYKSADLAANSTFVSDGTVTPGATYYYKISAFNAAGETFSAAASVTTPASAPAAPTTLTFASVTTNALTLNWSDNATNETGYRVYRSTDGSTFTKVADLAANTTSFGDSTLNAGTTYYYKVSAYNGAGETLSAIANTTTAASQGNPVTITTQTMVGFTELMITGTSGNDSIYVSQSNGVLTITANGQTTTMANTFGDIKISGAAGDDTITVASSVNINTLVYGGDGNNVIKDQTTGKATIVTLGNGTNTVTGNGINTAYWVNPGDTVNATSAETAINGVNRVNQFYQPWSSVTTNSDYISRELYGQNLRDPSDIGSTVRLTSNPFYGLGVSMNDINQGSRSDCYFVADLASLANNEPQKLMNQMVDFGDGTYGFKFVRSGVTSYVRVDGDLPAGGWSYGVAYAYPGADGNQWASLYEKAYAFFRSGSNTFSSLDYGNQNVAFNDLGFQSSGVSAGAGATSIMNTINTQLSAGHSLTANTNGSISGGAPLIGSHVYSIIGAYVDSSGTVWIQLRNPWGFDGAGSDSNPNDGLVTITYAQFSANFGTLSYTTV